MKRRDFLNYTSFLIGGLSLGSFTGFTNSRSIKFGVITDLHYAAKGPLENNNRYYNESLDKLSEFVEIMNDQQVDFIIELGDFKDQDNVPNEANTLRYLSQTESEFGKFNGPTYHVLGNHDIDSISKQQFLDSITNAGQVNAKSYYSFSAGGFHFIVLDANYTSAGIEYNRGNFDWKDTFIPTSQLEWLQNELKETNSPVILSVHQRLDYSEPLKNYCVKNSKEVQQIISDSGKVLLVLQGHHHQGDLNKKDDVVYLTMKAAVEGSGPDNNNYGMIEINGDHYMKLTGFRKTPTQEL